jgi:ABC-type cobalamin transport system permease subunit
VPVAQPVGIHYVRLPHPLLPQSKDAGRDSPILVGVLAVTAALVLTLIALRISRRRTLDARTHGG